MSYEIDKSLEFCNTVIFKTDSGAKYSVTFAETAPGSQLWTFSLKLSSGEPNEKEVFKTMSLVNKVITEKNGIIERNNIKKVIVTIDGKDQEEIEKKTYVFTRWIKKPWIYEIIKNPVIKIQGMKKNIYLLQIKKNSSQGIDRWVFFITFVKHLRQTTIQIQNLKKKFKKNLTDTKILLNFVKEIRNV